MKTRNLTAVIIATIVGTSACASGVQFNLLGEFYATGVSADGSVIVGNSADNLFETVRWTVGDGVVRLGRETMSVFGVGAGIPGVSDDGTRISATITSDDGTFITQGLWTEGSGWQTLSPYPSDMGIVDSNAGSAWNISGDGNHVVGLYWRAGATDGIAHASTGTLAGGVVGLGSTGGASRANASNYDGSVIVGWDEAADGHWRSVVWVNGVQTILHDQGAFTEAVEVNAAGDMVVGDAWNEATSTREAAIWRWDGASWDEQILGTLPGTFEFWGRSIANGVSADGSVVVGYNVYDFGPFSDTTGFVWTAGLGMVSIESYLSMYGVSVDPLFDFISLTGVSADGKTLIGYGIDWRTFQYQSFSVTIPAPGTLAVASLGLLAARRRRSC
ncbi:MAG: hypothetical protein KF838_03660 [Phycisphaeraceae bacterium]|nr:MAG: hypothetical protein KF838_03660 [Phycisphaeraceae bacterium]